MKKNEKPTTISRRNFGRKAAATAAAAQFCFNYIPAHAFGKLEKPALAGIGAGGKGRSDIQGSLRAGFQLRALVDVVDATKLPSISNRRLKSIAAARDAHPSTEFFTDYREMLEKLGDKVDAVTVSTPDHHHFHASLLAMRSGKHVYCQKPLTHGIWEARSLAETARQTGVKTQMGNQAHANDHMRRCVELIRAGIIGPVKEIHAWTNRPIWPQGFAAPPPAAKVPPGINWEQWIGPAPFVDYSPKIAPFAWRGWWDYGTGALGDMACHIMDMGYWAMGLATPKSVIAQQQGGTELSPPISSHITWEFPANQYSAKDGFSYHWYDGYVNARFDRDNWALAKQGNEFNHPDNDVLEGLSFQEFGSVIVGEAGKLYFNRGRNQWVAKPSSRLDGFAWPKQSIPRAPGQNNYQEWMDAINGKIDQGQSHFGNSGPLTETVLLGVLAQRFPDTRLEWDASKLEVSGRRELTRHIKRRYRRGWELDA